MGPTSSRESQLADEPLPDDDGLHIHHRGQPVSTHPACAPVILSNGPPSRQPRASRANQWGAIDFRGPPQEPSSLQALSLREAPGAEVQGARASARRTDNTSPTARGARTMAALGGAAGAAFSSGQRAARALLDALLELSQSSP